MVSQAVRTSTDADNVVTVVLDLPGKPVNVCTPGLLEELSAAVDSLSASKPAGIVITSAKARSFNVGADLVALRDMSPEHSGAYLGAGQALFERIRALPVPTVAAINGDCLGGGMELALACASRVVADDDSIALGLPEVTLGLIPAWGGATWLPRTIGLKRALGILLTGRTMQPREARQCSLVDQVVARDGLLAAARKLVLDPPQPRRPGMGRTDSACLSPARARVLAVARRRTVERTLDHSPAPLRLIDVVRTGYEQGVAAGLAAEREAILQLMQTESTRNLLRLFFLRRHAKRRAADQLKAKPAQVNEAVGDGAGAVRAPREGQAGNSAGQ